MKKNYSKLTLNSKKTNSNSILSNASTGCFESETNLLLPQETKVKNEYNLPMLNFDTLKSFNYDSEKENYSNMEDKLKKIKKRFESINLQK